MKKLPFSLAQVQEIIKTNPTPWYIYDQAEIENTSKLLYRAFNWVPGFTNYFAVKALPNPAILKVVKAQGMGADCSSLAELVLADKVGFRGEQIMFTSNDTSVEEFQKAYELGAVINLDDISHLEFLEEVAGLPELLCFRFNPGSERTGNKLIGAPEEAKYGLTRAQVLEAYKTAKVKGVKRFGIHTMLASNELNASYFVETAHMMFDLATQLKHELGIEVEFINLGGGFGIPYKPDQEPLDIQAVSKGVKKLYNEMAEVTGLKPKLFLELGRYITGPHGYLVATVLHLKHIYRDYVGLDASMSNLMRPGMYGAYHHITILGKEREKADQTYDVTGSLCENNDKFAIGRQLPEVSEGDIVVIHDTGAHGHSMGFQYNGKLRSAELLLKPNGKVELIRRAETLDDYFATINF